MARSCKRKRSGNTGSAVAWRACWSRSGKPARTKWAGRFPGADGTTQANDAGHMRPLTKGYDQRLPHDLPHNYGAALKDYNLGNLGNTIAGAIGGVGGGQLLQAIIPAIASAAAGGGLDVGALVGQIVGGGAGGAILTIIAGLVKSMMASQQTR